MFNNTIRKNVIASFCFFALLFAAAVGVVDAQSENPIEDDEILACVSVGDEIWATPVALKQQLEDVTGQPATVETMSHLMGRLPVATPSNGLRFEGGYPSVSVAQNLDDLGYESQIQIAQPAVPGAMMAVRRSL
jgi:hypothetical protein